MGCMVKIEIHEDDFDNILDLIGMGMKYLKEHKKEFEYYKDLKKIYIESFKDLKNYTTLVDVFDGHDRTEQKETRINWPKV